MDPEVVFGFGESALICCDTAANEKLIVLVVIIRAAAELCDIIFKTVILASSIVPNVIQIKDGTITQNDNSTIIPSNIAGASIVGVDIVDQRSTNGSDIAVFRAEDYKLAAYSYISFYVLGLLAAARYWGYFFEKKKFFPFASFAIALVCDMPLMVSEMCLLKAGGVIDWDEQKYDLILQVCFLVNVFLQVYCDVGRACSWFSGLKKCAIFGHVFLLALDFLVVCILYAPVMWALVGFLWFQRIQIGVHVKGLVTSQESRDALDVLMMIGSIGQWIIAVVIIAVIIICICCSGKHAEDE